MAAGALLQLLYIAAACWHCWNGRLWEAVGMIAFGWTGCMIFMLVCMRDATLDALGEGLNELDELWDAGSTYMERAKALMDAVEAEAMKCGILSHPLAVCPKCGEEQVRKVYSAVPIEFKGSGFYRTDKSK